MTSHAAVVARGWGRCCVVGAHEVEIHEKARKIVVKGRTFKHDDTISIDGSTGEVMAGVDRHQFAETVRRLLQGDGLG
jgi:pyruvate, orthophosphate dikinase